MIHFHNPSSKKDRFSTLGSQLKGLHYHWSDCAGGRARINEQAYSLVLDSGTPHVTGQGNKSFDGGAMLRIVASLEERHKKNTQNSRSSP